MTSATSPAKRIDNNNRINREGLRGWLNPLRYGWERVSYWFQRLTGIFLQYILLVMFMRLAHW